MNNINQETKDLVELSEELIRAQEAAVEKLKETKNKVFGTLEQYVDLLEKNITCENQVKISKETESRLQTENKEIQQKQTNFQKEQEKQLQEEQTKLQKERIQIQQEQTKLQQERDQFQQTVTQLEQGENDTKINREKLRHESESLQQANNSLQQANNSLQQANESLNAKFNTLESSLKRYEGIEEQLHTLRQILSEKEKDLENTSALLAEATKHTDQIDNYEKNNQHLTQEKQHLTQENQHFAQENQRVIGENQHFAQENQRLIEENQRLIEENQRLIGENQRVTQDNQRLVGENRAYAVDHSAAHTHLDQALRNIQNVKINLGKLGFGEVKISADAIINGINLVESSIRKVPKRNIAVSLSDQTVLTKLKEALRSNAHLQSINV